jgi:hypothetical protein
MVCLKKWEIYTFDELSTWGHYRNAVYLLNWNITGNIN